MRSRVIGDQGNHLSLLAIWFPTLGQMKDNLSGIILRRHPEDWIGAEPGFYALTVGTDPEVAKFMDFRVWNCVHAVVDDFGNLVRVDP